MWSSSAAGGAAYAVLPSKSAGNANAAIFVLNMIYSSTCCASEADDRRSGAPSFTGLAPATTAGVRANLEARCFCAMSRSSGASNSCFTPCYPREFAPKRTRAQPDDRAEPSLSRGRCRESVRRPVPLTWPRLAISARSLRRGSLRSRASIRILSRSPRSEWCRQRLARRA